MVLFISFASSFDGELFGRGARFCIDRGVPFGVRRNLEYFNSYEDLIRARRLTTADRLFWNPLHTPLYQLIGNIGTRYFLPLNTWLLPSRACCWWFWFIHDLLLVGRVAESQCYGHSSKRGVWLEHVVAWRLSRWRQLIDRLKFETLFTTSPSFNCVVSSLFRLAWFISELLLLWQRCTGTRRREMLSICGALQMIRGRFNSFSNDRQTGFLEPSPNSLFAWLQVCSLLANLSVVWIIGELLLVGWRVYIQKMGSDSSARDAMEV